jgi:hypothetical protein
MTRSPNKKRADARFLALLGASLLTVLGPASLVAEQGLRPAPRGQEELASQFDARWKTADGPAALRELEAWCLKNKLGEQRTLVAQVLARLSPPDRLPGDLAARESMRSMRSESRKALREFMAGRGQAAQADLEKLIAWMKTERFAPLEAKTRLGALVGELTLDPSRAASLQADVAGLEHVPGSVDEDRKRAKDFAERLGGLLKPLLSRLFFAVDRCLAAGEHGLAFDVYQWLLRLDPENERAHRGLGETRLGARWLRPFEVDQVKTGLSWDEKLGWIFEKERARYEAGDYFDLDGKRWAKLADLNRLHAQPATPWKLRSEHFELFSTADLELSVRVLGRLEAFFLQAFRQYDLFFAGKGGSGSLIFGMAPVRKRLVINFYRDRDQFVKEAKPPVAWAAGFYTSQKHASYFHAQGDTFVESTLQHELTHQILGEFSQDGSPAQWLAEGAAVYLEDAFFQNGTLTLGSLENHSRLITYRADLRAGQKEHSLRDVLKFVTIRDWDSGDIQMNYRGVGAVLYFLMTFDGGRYRGDTIAYLRDAYAGNPRSVEDYFGLSGAALDYLMARFYKDCEPGSVAPISSGFNH